MKTFARNLFFLSAVLFTIILVSCSKNNNGSGTAQLQVKLTDSPGNYDSVIIDVQDIQINVTTDSSGGWQSLPNVTRGKYNLLDLVNGKDTLLANANIPSGTIQQMRLVLGSDNSIVVNGQSYPLQTPSAQQSGLKLNIHQAVASGILYTMTLDFDVARSIVVTGNGSYILKPVIRTILNAVGGSIKGVVLPDTVRTAVFAIQGTDTVAGTFTSNTGDYLMRGLAAGTYSVGFRPTNTSFSSQRIDNINVSTGTVTIVDTVRLH